MMENLIEKGRIAVEEKIEKEETAVFPKDGKAQFKPQKATEKRRIS